MNLTKLPTWQKGLILLIIISTVTTLVVFQINTVGTATKVETTLFNVLQFIFSIIFAWLLSAFMGESQFIESQRKFAIGAFRRIKEIERSIHRTEKFLSYLERGTDEVIKSKVIAVKGGLAAMKDTVRSSIADWSDIIGDEIQISNEINKLQKLRNESDDLTQDTESINIEEVEEKINHLIESLPKELASEIETDEDSIIHESIENLADLWLEEGGTYLHCFWAENSDFGSDLNNIKVDDRLYLARGMTESRMGAFMLFNSENKQIAVVTNHCTTEATYENFVEAFEEFYGRKLIPSVLNGIPLSVKVLEIEDYDHEAERQYLTVQVEQSPQHACVFENIENEVELIES